MNRKSYELWLFFLVIMSLLNGCRNKDTTNGIEFNDVKPLVDAYILDNEIFYSPNDEEYPTPSYHLYFYLFNQDTIVSIVQRPFLAKSHIVGVEEGEQVFYEGLEPIGFINYKDKFPLIIFDPDSLIQESKTFSDLRSVPSEYEFNGLNIHRNQDTWDYHLKNGIVERKDLTSHITVE